jgi:hypothetical protein
MNNFLVFDVLSVAAHQPAVHAGEQTSKNCSQSKRRQKMQTSTIRSSDEKLQKYNVQELLNEQMTSPAVSPIKHSNVQIESDIDTTAHGA